MAPEKRLIDANELVDRLYDNEFAMLCPLDEVCGVIDSTPTADAIPIPCCKTVNWNCPVCCHCGAKMDLEV